MLKSLYKLSSAIGVSSVILLSASSAGATSGPTGSNAVLTETGPGVGQVTINWARYYQNVDSYRIVYGTQPGKYTFGTGNLGNSVVTTISSLNPGQKYYFYLYPSYQGQPLTPVSPEVSEVAAATPHTVVGTSGPYGSRTLTATTGPSKGQVTLTWTQKNPATTGFNVVYGTQPGKYTFGAQNVGLNGVVGTTVTFTVGYLNPGQRYYFAVNPLRNDGTGFYNSAEVSQVAHN